MEMKHTPGPWELSTDPDEPEVVAELCTSGLAHFLIVPTRDATLGDIAADACLIAAAPELLEALKKVAQSLEWYAHGRCRGFDDGAPLPTNEAVELAKRTIAKAIGHDG